MMYVLLISILVLIWVKIISVIKLVKVDRELLLTDEYDEHIEKLFVKKRRLSNIILFVVPTANAIIALILIITLLS